MEKKIYKLSDYPYALGKIAEFLSLGIRGHIIKHSLSKAIETVIALKDTDMVTGDIVDIEYIITVETADIISRLEKAKLERIRGDDTRSSDATD